MTDAPKQLETQEQSCGDCFISKITTKIEENKLRVKLICRRKKIAIKQTQFYSQTEGTKRGKKMQNFTHQLAIG